MSPELTHNLALLAGALCATMAFCGAMMSRNIWDRLTVTILLFLAFLFLGV